MKHVEAHGNQNTGAKAWPPKAPAPTNQGDWGVAGVFRDPGERARGGEGASGRRKMVCPGFWFPMVPAGLSAQGWPLAAYMALRPYPRG